MNLLNSDFLPNFLNDSILQSCFKIACQEKNRKKRLLPDFYSVDFFRPRNFPADKNHTLNFIIGTQ